MLPLGQHLALSSPWWSWDCTAVRKALWASVLVRLRRLGNDRLKANGAAGRSPGSWKDLEFLRRDAKTHRRMFDGKTNLCLELLLGYAGVLGIDAGDCFPDTETWIAEAARYLAEYAPGGTGSVRVPDARTYVTHVLPRVTSSVRTAADVGAWLERMPDDTRAAVVGVARTLGPILEAIYPDAKVFGGGSGR
jgi:hypothetical protein